MEATAVNTTLTIQAIFKKDFRALCHKCYFFGDIGTRIIALAIGKGECDDHLILILHDLSMRYVAGCERFLGYIKPLVSKELVTLRWKQRYFAIRSKGELICSQVVYGLFQLLVVRGCDDCPHSRRSLHNISR